MPYERIKNSLTGRAPFFTTVGMVLDSVQEGYAKAHLDNRKEISNHLGTVHAGALFTLGEGLSGAAVLGAFADCVDQIRAVSTKADITYVGISRGLTLGEAKVRHSVPFLRQQLDREGKLECDVDVILTTGTNMDVATMVVTWLISKRKAQIL